MYKKNGRASYPFHLQQVDQAETTDIDYLYSVNDLRIYKKSVLSEDIPEVGTVITGTTYDYYLMDAMGKTVAIFHSKDNDQGLVESWEYYASGAERECRLVPTSAQVPGANTSNTNVKFQKDQASFYLYDHLGNTRVTYTPTITTTLNQTQVLNNTFTGTTDGWSATSNTTISSVNNQLEVLTSNTTASVSKVIPFSANTDYSVSIDVTVESVGVPADEPNVSLTIISGGNAVAQTTLVDGNNTLTFTSLSQPPTVAFVQINGTLTNYRVHLDNFIVSEVDATTEYSNIINSVVDYFPYGKVLREYVGGVQERYLTTQHERDVETDLDYRGARYYCSDVARFLAKDPLEDQFPAWSTYHYVLGNPILLTDPTGEGPGDLFKTTDEAANDWGETYAAKSIRKNREYASTIYIVEKNGETFYTYTRAKKGNAYGVNAKKNPKGTTLVADIHSHGAYDPELDNTDGHIAEAKKVDSNNEFSSTDRATNYEDKIDGYVTTPNGSLLFNDYIEGESISDYLERHDYPKVVNTDQPSDPEDPSRKNTISPFKK